MYIRGKAIFFLYFVFIFSIRTTYLDIYSLSLISSIFIVSIIITERGKMINAKTIESYPKYEATCSPSVE